MYLKSTLSLVLGLALFGCGGGGGGGGSSSTSISQDNSSNPQENSAEDYNQNRTNDITSLTEIDGELPSLEGYIFANEHGIYHWSENVGINFIDIVLLRPDGGRSTYTFDRHLYGTGLYTNLTTDSSRIEDAIADNGFHYESISIPVEQNGAYYFSTILGVREDGNHNIQDWVMTFADDGSPLITGTDMSVPACQQVYTVRHTCDIRWTYSTNLNNHDNSDDIRRTDIPFDSLYSVSGRDYATVYDTAGLLIDGFWYGFSDQNNTQASFVIVNPQREAEYININLTDSLGSPVRDLAATTLRYHPEKNSVYFIARDSEPSYIGNIREYLIGEYQIDSGILQWTTTLASNYHDIMSAIALADDGIFILSDDLGTPRYYSSENNSVSLVDVAVPNARLASIITAPTMLPNGDFFYVESISNWDLRNNRVVFADVN